MMVRTAGNLSARMAQGLSAQAIWIVWPANTGQALARPRDRGYLTGLRAPFV